MPKPIGRITRGTTGVNRLRRVDRWIAAQPVLRQAADPLVVDLGYGASATTSLELWRRLAAVRAEAEVVGIEIDPERVRLATEQLTGLGAGRGAERVTGAGARRGSAGSAEDPAPNPLLRAVSPPERPAVSFRLGGFEVPLDPPTRRPAVIRAMNVLRQYEESEVADAWARLRGRLQPGGILVEGTCSEDGRLGAWATLDAEGPRTLTLGMRLASIGSAAIETPGVVAERLPKALIHRNVPGEPIHAFLLDLNRSWAAVAPLGVYGPTQRWIATAAALRERWPIVGGRARWRLGELTVDWAAVAPS